MDRIRLAAIAACLFVTSALGQASDASRLTLDRIFASDEFNTQGVGAIRWLHSGDAYTRLEPAARGRGRDLVAYNAATGAREVLVAAARFVPSGAGEPLAVQNYDWSADAQKLLIYTNSKKVWRQNTRGDYWVLDLPSGKLTKLGGSDAKPSTLMFAKFSPDGRRVGYVRESNIYVEDLTSGKITALTTDGSKTLINGTSDWVNEEEFNLRDCWRWSPDSRLIAFWQFNADQTRNYYLINDTDTLYPEITAIPYPKVGTTNSAVRIGVVGADGGQITWLKTPGDPRQNYVAMMEWTDKSNEIVLQHLNRLQNTLQLMSADPATGNVRAIVTERDDAWVDVDMPKMQWLDGGKRFLWLSERDGWQHIYSVSRDGSDVKLLTPGNFDATGVSGVDENGGWVYFIASPENAGQRYLFRSRLDGGGKPERVTPASQAGWNGHNISPTGKWAVHTFSAFSTVPRAELVDLTGRSQARVLVDNSAVQARVDALNKGPQEFFKIDIGGGTQLDGWMMKPPGFDPTKKYPILFYVYGEPAGQTVLDSWGNSNYLWHTMLTQQGYIVASVDNRGTPAPKGRAWRKSVYRRIGVTSSADQAAAVRAMIEKMPFIDATRVGIWGWSGGGSSTLNAMFRYPDVYRMGMSIAPVPDQTLYDTIYQERYMGLPQDNAEDYKQGSPITFAERLKGDLLIVHGSGDDNVHYQGTERLINKLITLNKRFQMMAYPNRTHSISEGENTSRHLFSLLTSYLNAHLPAGNAANAAPTQ